ncbi:hypothetical protein L3049_18750 [Labilibaculum sp. DW002]|uniref:DUF4393 domain-containing protein n=1 Tax=Paralabilibaculum antarcticum TaxID=2912572 RepID=A0ABT5VX84_9BACT|nr:hypothetical protein [Labilibaculum sp. DW002]MDE5420034.1 hypothetical protein [Labilibaculum sp. DW002]
MLDKSEFQNNETDHIVSIIKSTVGIIPFAGPLLSEIVGNIIPNQRIDRLTEYIKILDKNISKIPKETIIALKNNPDFIDLIEEGFVQASRAKSDNRRKYIASIITNGISEKSIQLIESKYLLKILEELNDAEIIWLRYYYDSTRMNENNFYNEHRNILSPVSVSKVSGKESHNKASIQSSYKEHLERLQLIKYHIQIDKKSGIAEFNRQTGKPKVTRKSITHLGILILEQMGLIEE